ncbi:YrhC family protein [Alkalihalobacterium elongatum]|uniref:YrhC family protein n=1 Tax=Alkalihalobacterium elongatum TaxID=2675466 RepID=UPI001C1F6796|nr:YrhC family protein [Alkalihalobacterium elongatum]
MDDNKKIREIKGKVEDYKRFGFILLSLSVFMFLGLIIPNDVPMTGNYAEYMMGGIVLSLVMAFIFHRKAMHYRNQLDNEEYGQ